MSLEQLADLVPGKVMPVVSDQLIDHAAASLVDSRDPAADTDEDSGAGESQLSPAPR